MALVPHPQAQELILRQISRLPACETPVADALGLVAASDIASPEPIPAWDNTAMDGFAVLASDTTGASDTAPATLAVVATLPAGGRPDTPVAPGQAIRIMTGAPMPPGADAVVPVEYTAATPDSQQVDIHQPAEPGAHIRRAGEDLTAGQLAVAADTWLTPAHLGVLASIGATSIAAYPKPKVAVFSTGDELVSDGSALEVGQIRDSNRIAIISRLAEGGFESVNAGVIPDDEAAIETAFVECAQRCDAVITTGGVSMGDFDYVKLVLDRVGQMNWLQIAIRPAKPLAFGTIGGTPVFGLPGNPVSCLVSYELFAYPALRKMAGHAQLHKPQLRAIAAEPLTRHPDGKTHFVRVRWSYVDGRYELRSVGGQGSHQLSVMAAANGLAILPDSDGIDQGEEVEFIQLGN